MILSMPKVETTSSSHRNSISTASAAGGGTRSSSWSTKDDETLIQARAQGLNWNQIAPKHFPSKSPNACRKRHERLMERQNAEQWDGGVKLEDLARAYMEVRREMWSILASRVGEKWTLVEQKVRLWPRSSLPSPGDEVEDLAGRGAQANVLCSAWRRGSRTSIRRTDRARRNRVHTKKAMAIVESAFLTWTKNQMTVRPT